ncbi:class I SAM-dependent methyltransferase [Mycolicibacterium arseniciresistens]|uniref:Methyltransferase domain-containing protein n=1 Tax=Mycolicibacterium arseniciresistens TaxID=3062257 RepID=A0ABT8U9X0_9MYCO|nr:methyltransferase domain-containing protein [Mycolicibacterium arseniciresistens]MDO3634593.1 methyltransferase domain-containing protein [Mycolicibacterium arseniciresistens]
MAQSPPPDPDRAREKYRRLARTYDQFISIGGRVEGLPRHRARAIDNLDLQPGDVVIDVGCGTGLSFDRIEQQIGQSGRIIGFELSPDMLELARERAQRRGWSNIDLMQGAVEDARAGVEADAALFCLVHDITRSRRALENMLGQLKPGGHIAVLGAKVVPRRPFPLNLSSRRLMARFVTTFNGVDRPWTILAELVPDLQVELTPLRVTYLAWGRTPTIREA